MIAPSATVRADRPAPAPSIVRPHRRRDIPGVVELRRVIWPDDVTTPASWAWDIDHPDPAELRRRWVAISDDRVVGFAVAGLAAWATGRVATAYFGVAPERRREGIGRTLFRAIEGHLARLGASQTLSATEQGGDGPGFLAARGFRHTRDDQAWGVDPRAVSVDELPSRRAAAEADGFRLVPTRLLLDRPEALRRLPRALEQDLPSDVPIAQAYATWRTHELDTPLFAPDASFCVLLGDEPVALTWIRLDLPGHRAQHGMTGTLPAYRHRGLARLVKLASIAWLADRGVIALYTTNDTENRDMLALNEHLGFRPLTVFEMWAREA